jgi:hypothetical protein
MQIETLYISGFYSASYGARLSYGGSSLEKLDSDYETDNLGNKDKNLLSKLVQRGNSHAKAVRMINVSFYIRANNRFLSQLDTYKIGTVSASSSTMHTIMKRDLTNADFSTPLPNAYLAYLNLLRNKKEFKRLVDSLPMGYLYERVMLVNYQTLRSIYYDRLEHRYDYWDTFLSWIEELPHSKELIINKGL